jgi:stearoyl-CoA desaturase (Delta-9 desaturase)
MAATTTALRTEVAVKPHTHGEQAITLVAVVLPLIGVLAAAVWISPPSITDIALFAAFYVACGFGVTVGYHRLATHKSFETAPGIRALLIFLGALTVQGSPLHWVSDHRLHHGVGVTDREGDPHSPHYTQGGAVLGVVRGLIHAHTGWLFSSGSASAHRYAKDLLEDKAVLWIHRRYAWVTLFSLALPTLLGFALTGTWQGALGGYIWGGLVRIFITHHATWSVNSICHMWGSRRFDTDDRSTNNWMVSLGALGEGFHHNHHAFPSSAYHGLKRWERFLDFSGLFIRFLALFGLAWDVRTVTESRILDEEAKAAQRQAANAV